MTCLRQEVTARNYGRLDTWEMTKNTAWHLELSRGDSQGQKLFTGLRPNLVIWDMETELYGHNSLPVFHMVDKHTHTHTRTLQWK